MSKRQSVLLFFSAASVLFNVLVGTLVSSVLAVPLLYMDSVGTVFITVFGGLPYGIVVGVLSNILKAILSGRSAAAYFAIVNVAVAVTTAAIARRRFTLDRAIVTGFVLSLVSAFFSLFVRLFFVGGHTGSGTDAIIEAMMAMGNELVSATFFSAITSNLVDKLLTCFIVWGVIYLLPASPAGGWWKKGSGTIAQPAGGPDT